jgi:L-amino acid N-acyltransferase YncA
MTENLTFRLVTADDANQILEIYDPIVRATSISFEETPPSEADIRMRIERLTCSHPWIVATDIKSQVVGYAYASPHRERAAYRWSVDVSAYVRDGFRGLGIGGQLYDRLFKILKHQNYFRAFAGISLPNESSVTLHENAGFRHLGTYRNVGHKFGLWHDVGWWELTLRSPELNPAEPIPVREALLQSLL